jgi:hypothetical protein
MDNLMKKVRSGSSLRNFWVMIPPWIILGALLVLIPIFAFITLGNIHRENELTTRLLIEKGEALIRSFEAGARAGAGLEWGSVQLQKLLIETARQPGWIISSSPIRRGSSWRTAILPWWERYTVGTWISGRPPDALRQPGAGSPMIRAPIPLRCTGAFLPREALFRDSRSGRIFRTAGALTTEPRKMPASPGAM